MSDKRVEFEGFKDSVLGKIPREWECLTIYECLQANIISDIQDGNHGEKHPTFNDFVQEGIPFIMAKDLANGKINIADCHKITKQKYESLRVGFAYPGDVLLSHKGTIGLTAIVPDSLQNIMLTPQVTYYRILEQTKLNKEFLFYFFQSFLFQQKLEILSIQSTRAYIGITLQKKLSIFIPPLPEQKQIAKILDTIDELITVTETQINKLKKIKAGLLNDLLTRGIDENGELRDPIKHPEQFKDSVLGRIPKEWDIYSLNFISSKIQDGTHFSPKTQEGKYRYITSKVIKFGYLNLSDCGWISEDEHKIIYKRCDVQLGDILLTKDGVNVGNAAINILNEPFSLLSSVAFIRPNKIYYIAEFLLQYLLSPIGQQRLTDMISGLAITRLTLEKIKNFTVPISLVEEQEKISSILKNYDTHIQTKQTRLEKLKLLKKGLMNDLLTGKVRVNLPKIDID